MPDPELMTARDGSTVLLTLNSPHRRNAFSPSQFEQFLRKLEESAADEELDALVITGAGSAFCAGGDLRDRSPNGLLALVEEGPEAFLRFYTDVVGAAIARLRALTIPTIAMVNGPAYGMGLDIAVACDVRIGSPAASFCNAWIRRGLVPAGGAASLLPAIIGSGRANEIILSGRRVDAEEAERIGLLNRVVSGDQLTRQALELARGLSRASRTAISSTKSLVRGTGGSDDFASELQRAAVIQSTLLGSPEYQASLADLARW